MKLIAHRGLIDGPNTQLENSPEQVRFAIDKGFDCEIDLWINGNEFYLGHDLPQYRVTKEFIELDNLWIHAKNINALHYLLGTDLQFFWHQNDDYTLTSNGKIWTYPGKLLTKDSIMVMPEWSDPTLNNAKQEKCFAVCSDYVSLLT